MHYFNFNRKAGEWKIIWLMAAFAAALTGIAAGSFFDLSVSQVLASDTDLFAKCLESFGEVLGESMASVGSALVLSGLSRKYGRKGKGSGIFLTLICIVVSAYFMAPDFSGQSGYSWKFSREIGFVIGCIWNTICFFAVYTHLNSETPEKRLIVNGMIMILTLILTTLLVNLVLKGMAYRPRFRALAWDNVSNGTEAIGLSCYRNWWEFSFWKKPNWFEAMKIPSDYIKSWPSGHTACAAVALTCPYAVSVMKGATEQTSKRAFLIAFAYTLLVAYARIRKGAHFLSDVSFGLLVTLVVMTGVYLMVRFCLQDRRIK